jgi:hypothetical protein
MHPMLIGAAMLLLPQCPYFYEFLPDPTTVPDTQGEYLVVKWESQVVPWDTIYFKMEEKEFEIYIPKDSLYTELILHRDENSCANKKGTLCLPLTSPALPNSKESVWSLRAGECRDTANLPIPKPGKPFFLREKEAITDTIPKGTLYISEVAPCPEEGIPEWFEITNKSLFTYSLNGISDCEKTPLETLDSIKGGPSILITKDSTELRTFLQTENILIYQLGISALKNTADTIKICKNEIVLDSVAWGREVNKPIKCPGTEKISPGFVPKVKLEKTKYLQISERILTRSKKSMLRIKVNKEQIAEFRLIDKNGNGIAKKTLEASSAGSWIEIPEWRKCQNGPCFIHLKGEGINETAAFVVRP